MSGGLKFPREHGAWAMLYVPFVIGALAGSISSVSLAPLILLLLSTTFVFVARAAMVEWSRARSRGKPSRAALQMMVICLGLGCLAGVPLLLIYHRLLLAPFAILTAIFLAFNTRQVLKREDRTVIGETIAIFGLTLTAPSAYYVASGSLNTTALGLWVICVLYFTSSVFYVKLRVHSISNRREELMRQSWNRCAAYHLFLTTALLLLTATGSLDLFVLFAFTPVLSRTVWQLVKPGGKTNLKRVGLLEIVYSVVFLVFVTLSFRAA